MQALLEKLDSPDCMAALYILAAIASGLRSGFIHPHPMAVAALISNISPEAIFIRLADLTEVSAVGAEISVQA